MKQYDNHDVLCYRLINPVTKEKSAWVFTENAYDTICVGIKDTEGNYHQFESEAYYIFGWAESKGFEVEKIEELIQLPL